MESAVLYAWFALWLAVAASIGYWVGRQRKAAAESAPTHPRQVRITLLALGALQCTCLLMPLSGLPIFYAFPRFHWLLQDDMLRLGYWLGVGVTQLTLIIAEVALYLRFRHTRPA